MFPASVSEDGTDHEPINATADVLSRSSTFNGTTDAFTSGQYWFSESAGNASGLSLQAGALSLSYFAQASETPYLGGLIGFPNTAGDSSFITGDPGEACDSTHPANRVSRSRT